MMEITEINIVPVKPNNGLIGFCSFVLLNCFYVSNIAIHSRLDGGIRLVYPDKQVGGKSFYIIRPLTKEIGDIIEKAIENKWREVMG